MLVKSVGLGPSKSQGTAADPKKKKERLFMCRFLEKEAAIGSLFKGRLRERKKGRRFILAEKTERASEAIQQAFTQKETVNDRSFQLVRSASGNQNISPHLFLS